MTEIAAKVRIKKVDQWDINWNKPIEKKKALYELEYDMKIALLERCGIDPDCIEIEFEV